MTGADNHREPLQQALIDLCYERGYADLTPGMLCARAGLARSELERRYRGLSGLFEAAYAAEFGRYRAQAAAARAGLSAWRDRLRATAYALARYLNEDPAITHFTVVEVRRAPEPTQLLLAEGIEELIGLLDEGRREPDAPVDLTRVTAESLAGGMFNQLYLSVAHDEAPDESQIVPKLMYTAVLPYLGPEVAAEELAIGPPPRAVPSGRDMTTTAARQRQLLARALIELCYERGLATLTVEQICVRAGLERSAFELHYADLEDCFCQVYQEERDLIAARLEAAMAPAQSWPERLRAVAYSLHDSLSRDPAITHLVVIEILAAGERARLLQWEGVQLINRLLEEGRAEMADPESISPATAESIAGGMLLQLTNTVAHGPLPPARELIPKLMYSAVLPYLGPEAAARELATGPPTGHSPI